MSPNRRFVVALCGAVLLSTSPGGLAAAQQAPPTRPATSPAGGVRPIPPPGNEIAPKDRTELEVGVIALGIELGQLQFTLQDKPELAAYLPDMQIYHNAVRYPLQHKELLDLAKARKAIDEGIARARQLRAGKPEWIHKDGPRGYVSKIDGSVQPYYLMLPTDHDAAAKGKRRLDLFCHGRDEKLTELNFISSKVGNAPSPGPGKFVVLLYGRYCNANKMAGEVDCFEAMADVGRRHPIDPRRVILTGFSMGGGAVWHLTVHYPDVWAATSPGAGFAESPVFLNMRQSGEWDRTPWYQRTLFHQYDCTDWAANLSNVRCIAYSGDLDKQILASELMEKAAAAENLKLERLIGPKTDHKYHPETRKEIDRRLDAYAEAGKEVAPSRVTFVTWTLRYPKSHWVVIDGMERHWRQARVEASLVERDGATGVEMRTINVNEFTLAFPASASPFKPGSTPKVLVDGQTLDGPPVADPAAAWTARYFRESGKWRPRTAQDDQGLRKRHGLQGPIDDAFIDAFTIVRPTGKAMNEKIGAWTAAECDRAIDQWRKTFRGEARVAKPGKVSLEKAETNLVLFGDPSSNPLIAQLIERLPVRWTKDTVIVGDKTYPADRHVPVLIYPNPFSPAHYVVINSGFTFREADHLNNARQIPRLPDYAFIDTTEPPTASGPGKVVDAGFFGERWELLPDGGR